MSRRVSSFMRLAPFLPLLVLGACSTVLGIEDVEEDPNAGQGGSSTTTDVAGGTKNTGGTKAGESSTASMGGSNGESGDGPGPIGGDGSTGGGSGPMGGDGTGGMPEPTDPTVKGRVIDFWGQPLASVPIQIGEEQQTTNDKGEFTFADVPPEYDVSLVVRPKNPDEDYGWVFQGLTRRDPTLQVYRARNQREGNVLVKVTGATLAANDRIMVAFGTPDGSTVSSADTSAGGQYLTPDWRGAITTSGTAHALHWTINAATELPSAYKAYQSKLIALSESADSEAIFDLTPSALQTGTVDGTVTPYGDDERTNMVFLRFPSNAYIPVVLETDTAPNTFNYLVPTLPDCSITVAAREGYEYGPMGIAHRDGLSAGDTSIALDIPEPAQPLSPSGASADAVTNDTNFNFMPSPDNKGAFVVSMENFDYYQTLFIVTTKKQFKIPDVAGGIFELDSAQFYRWRVETHGDFATVDEMTGASGFMDDFGDSWSDPTGPTQSSGSYTLSPAFGFTTAP